MSMADIHSAVICRVIFTVNVLISYTSGLIKGSTLCKAAFLKYDCSSLEKAKQSSL
jgi:hypothetical protein